MAEGWRVESVRDIRDDRDRLVAIVMGADLDWVVANARLIAAAPLLLEACKGLLSKLEEHDLEHCRAALIAEEAIAAATGETP